MSECGTAERDVAAARPRARLSSRIPSQVTWNLRFGGSWKSSYFLLLTGTPVRFHVNWWEGIWLVTPEGNRSVPKLDAKSNERVHDSSDRQLEHALPLRGGALVPNCSSWRKTAESPTNFVPRPVAGNRETACRRSQQLGPQFRRVSQTFGGSSPVLC